MLKLPTAIVQDLARHALAGYPAETCGLLFATSADDTATRSVAIPNEADRLHALDSEAYPRTSRDYFAMNGAKVARLVREAESIGERWLAIWHSHIDCGAYFSSEDRLTAAPDGVPVWPQLYQLVIDVRRSGPVEARAFLWVDGDFLPVATFPEFHEVR